MLVRVLLVLVAAALLSPGQSLRQLHTKTPLAPGETLVVGFMGGWERWNDPKRSVYQVAEHLRARPGVHAESLSNHRRRVARKLIEQALDTNRNGRLEPEEKQRAHIVLYGQSWGGAAVVKLARELERKKIPVDLTVQVDSVGLRDHRIPGNVRRAANYFQHEPLTIRGETEIRAADPTRTEILGNFQRRYPVILTPVQPTSWVRRLGGAHVFMEADPTLWAEVETLILANIVRQGATR
jgi:hypothetical protein